MLLTTSGFERIAIEFVGVHITTARRKIDAEP